MVRHFTNSHANAAFTLTQQKPIIACILLLAIVTAFGCRDLRIGSRVKPYFYFKNGKGHYCIPTDPHTYRGAIVRDFKADEDTFETIDSEDAYPYAKDKSHVWAGINRFIIYMKDADPSSFKLVTKDGRYTKDKNRVYFYGVPLPESDPQSFRILTKPYSADGGHVYAGHEMLEDADPVTFEVVEIGRAEIPWREDASVPSMPKLKSFPDLEIRGLGKDSNGFYRGPVLIKPADYDSFQFMGQRYAG
ncbi:MAG: DKNYY domain-containing protein [Pirellulaceae bacterium]